ncbi:hypothetical protein V8E36_008048, partial [Tilletia maclaganii]
VALFFFASAVTASPFDLNDDDSEHSVGLLFGRAPGTKYVGQSCTTSAECFSGNCASGICQRQVKGGACLKNANCASYNCYSNVCSAPSKIYGVCSSKTPCKRGLQCTQEGICKYGAGTGCSNNKQCFNNACINGVCSPGQTRPNDRCGSDSDCVSGKCDSSNSFQCRQDDGAYVDCPATITYEYGYQIVDPDPVCTRFSLGQPCLNNGECEIGICKNGICSANGDGQSCVVTAQCSNEDSFCKNGVCTNPADGTLYPRDLCSRDKQCVSNACIRDVAPKDGEGVNDGQPIYQERYIYPGSGPTYCNYLQLNQTGCRSLFDCALQLCKDSKCVYGSPGD